jgi:hypothetical protein
MKEKEEKKRNVHQYKIFVVFSFLRCLMLYFVCFNMHYFSNDIKTQKGDKHFFYAVRDFYQKYTILILKRQIEQ